MKKLLVTLTLIAAVSASPVQAGGIHWHLFVKLRRNIAQYKADQAAAAEQAKGETHYPNGLTVQNNWGWSEDHGICHVVGTLRNDNPALCEYVELDCQMIDKDGVVIDQGLANFTYLPAGATWKFDAIGLHSCGVHSVNLTVKHIN